MLDHEAAGCPVLPGEERIIVAWEKKRSSGNSHNVGSPDDMPLEGPPTTEAGIEQLRNSVTEPAEGESNMPWIKMGIQSQARKRNTRQIRNQHPAVTKGNAANKKSALEQKKLHSKHRAFDRFQDCKICVACIKQEKHPDLGIKIPKRTHNILCTCNKETRGRSASYVKTQNFFKRNATLAKSSLPDWRKENPNYPSVMEHHSRDGSSMFVCAGCFED